MPPASLHRPRRWASLAWVLAALPLWAQAAPLTKAQRAALRSACQDIVARTSLRNARAGILVETADGKVIYQRQAHELLNPASNTKLFTSAAALCLLGPDYRWSTDFLTVKPMKPNGEVKDLYVRGDGDPLVTTDRLYGIVNDLYALGLRRIRGHIYLDDSYFDPQRLGPGYDQDDSDHAYMAPTGALSLNRNAVQVDVFPGEAAGKKARVEIQPDSRYFEVENHAVTVRAHRRGRVRVKVSLDRKREKVVVWGRIALNHDGLDFDRTVYAPDRYFAATLRSLLRKRGIRFYGRIRHRVTPDDADVLYSAESPELATAVRKMNKVSSNFIAEQLVKTLGANLEGAPGSWAKGIDVVETFLQEQVGIPRGSYVMKNGSGLNDTNRFSAAQVVKVLSYMAKRFDASAEYLSSLGIAGKDGTVADRMGGTPAEGHIRAKTGTLSGVTALSGMGETLGGQRFFFSILVNDYPGRHSRVNAAMDDLGVALASAGGPVAPVKTAQQLVAAALPKQESFSELKAQVATYASLSKLHDKHNLAFLRTALRTERDPAARAVVAAALYESDPSSGAGTQAVLDTWNASPAVFGRLHTVARDLNRPVPGVDALLDIAAQGNAEALSQTVALAPLAQGDAKLVQTLADGLEEISRNAPEELLAALHGAPADASTAAVDLLVSGITASTEPTPNPFPDAVKKAEDAKDPDLAAFAKQLFTELQTKLALAKAAPSVNVSTPTSTVAPTLLPTKAGLAPEVDPAVAHAPDKP